MKANTTNKQSEKYCRRVVMSLQSGFPDPKNKKGQIWISAVSKYSVRRLIGSLWASMKVITNTE